MAHSRMIEEKGTICRIVERVKETKKVGEAPQGLMKVESHYLFRAKWVRGRALLLEPRELSMVDGLPDQWL